LIFNFEASELKIAYLREKEGNSYEVYVLLKNLKIKDASGKSLLVETAKAE